MTLLSSVFLMENSFDFSYNLSMNIYIVRHGRTLFNLKKLAQGWSDSPLLEEGLIQAKHLGENLASIPFDHAISSTSTRAIDTLDCIIEDRLTVEHYPDLRELNFGLMEGEPSNQVMPNGQVWEEGYEFYGGETVEKAVNRFTRCLKNYIESNHPENLLLVSHGSIIYYFLRSIDEEFRKNVGYPGDIIPNCSVTRVSYDDGIFHLDAWPDISYRGDEE